MMFRRAIEFVLHHEGGFANHPDDPGGVTNYGISLRFALSVGDLDGDGRPDLDVDGDGDVDARDIRLLTRDKAEDIYRRVFWNALRCDELPWTLALQVMDTGVNMGRGPAIVLLQRAVKVKADGKLGPITLGAVRGADIVHVAIEYQAERNWRYGSLSNFPVFGRGWMRRSAHCLAEALKP